MNVESVFADRKHAGQELAKMLEPRYKDRNVLVFGIPRGGVVVAYEVARCLRAELSVIITKKLPHPSQEELAIGACAEDGSVFLTSLARGLRETTIRDIVKAQQEEIESRIRRFRDGKPLPEIKNRTVIIVDDGIATGSTLVPALKLCRSQNAAGVVVAAPVSGRNYVSDIDNLADDVFVAVKPADFYAVGQVYDDFHHLSDEEVTGLLDSYRRGFVPTGHISGKP